MVGVQTAVGDRDKEKVKVNHTEKSHIWTHNTHTFTIIYSESNIAES